MSTVHPSTDRGSLRRSNDAAIYREAARLIEVGERSWSCCAVEQAIKGSAACIAYWSRATNKYRETFGIDGDLSIRQFEETGDGENVRILALCFMAAMVEAGDA